MAIYLIGYEGRTERPYDQLQEAMDREGGVKLIDGLWALDVDKDATELRDWVHAFMDDVDAIFIAQMRAGSHWASRHLKSSANDWLKSRL
ncbi:hypothetical protein [Rhizobium sp. EC-SD404]|uniref:hypothetical protein n=1 Tax=Rhizobium sp. EC-SD404 TaxID=2038389 RepID=UPI0012523174|nr:hypothetical protein [Rhizobium sp. EC-SD404]VVS98210.1 hypothetical protein RHIZ404_190025 [Rhizobium sp. EC-SD404]